MVSASLRQGMTIESSMISRIADPSIEAGKERDGRAGERGRWRVENQPRRRGRAHHANAMHAAGKRAAGERRAVDFDRAVAFVAESVVGERFECGVAAA